MDILEEIFSRAKDYPKRNASLRETLAKDGQHPPVALICCSDSRVIPEAIFDCELGELFVIRTAGNTLGPNELASFHYAYHHLHIQNFIVLAHTGCGAIESTINGEHCCIFDAIKGHIGDEVDPIRASILNALGVAEELEKEFPSVNVTPLLYDIETGKISLL